LNAGLKKALGERPTMDIRAEIRVTIRVTIRVNMCVYRRVILVYYMCGLVY